ncbi:Thoeris anti-defense Tad2 family protein [Sinorhizobium medicae]
MLYGEAIECMRRGFAVSRDDSPDAVVFLVQPGTPMQYFRKNTPDGLYPYVPSTDDQLADDWMVAA